MNVSAPVAFPANYVDPPPEPKVAYPEPPRGSSGLRALIHGSTFFTATEEGALVPPGSPNIGLFYQNTRFLSHYELRTNGQAPALLSCNSTRADLARVGLTVRGGAVAVSDLDLAHQHDLYRSGIPVGGDNPGKGSASQISDGVEFTKNVPKPSTAVGESVLAFSRDGPEVSSLGDFDGSLIHWSRSYHQKRRNHPWHHDCGGS